MIYERLEKCPVCGKTEFRNKLVVEDKSVSKESFAIQQCEACTFQFTNPRPDAAHIGRYYESDEYVSHNSGAGGVINQAYKVARFFTMRRKVALVNKLAPGKGRLFDYGCGTGHFLAAAKGNGWQVAGWEPNERARQEAAQRVGHNLELQADLTRFAAESFDVITLWHVLEHVHELNDTLQQLIRLLKSDGTLLIAVPNADSLDAQHYRQDWAAYDVPRHLYHFTPKTMIQLLKKHKMQVKEVLPMPLDAYYVSMLSEKHRAERGGGMLTVLKAGYKSNQYAATHEGQYSSLMYVARKRPAVG
ncbi:SAM-dependent methyltransferase [Hymenobacter luteus]|uniref:SAM-dependent methyltransferase n=2 Tax=Hymenobacter TaxID=89966 RepID=A0A7W9T637_9BACT|nr:class I SAM-dependent methyltransferase [Hymenobacter latericoloratus]MBB4603328.1 SAM-dependent methyltransferase [Hymenobacter latericoloratus]MBB6061114.1 SAM-dependent methyltransferase [Hymenobacter luteus]